LDSCDLPNSGIQSQKEFEAMSKTFKLKGVSVSSFGIGSDFNEDIMTSIAEYGGGSYAFIEKPEEIEQIVGVALQCLLGVVGRNAELVIEPINGAKLHRVFGFEDPREVLIGDIKQRNVKNTLAMIKLPATLTSGLDVEILRFTLRFVPAVDVGSSKDAASESSSASASASVASNTVELKGVISIPVVKADAEGIKTRSSSKIVAEARIVQTAGENDDAAAQLMEQGKKTEAIQLLQQNLDMCRLSAQTAKMSHMQNKYQQSIAQVQVDGCSSTEIKKAKERKVRNRHDSADWNMHDVAKYSVSAPADPSAASSPAAAVSTSASSSSYSNIA